MLRSVFRVSCATLGAALTLSACGDGPTAPDLFGIPGESGTGGSFGGTRGAADAGEADGGDSEAVGSGGFLSGGVGSSGTKSGSSGNANRAGRSAGGTSGAPEEGEPGGSGSEAGASAGAGDVGGAGTAGSAGAAGSSAAGSAGTAGSAGVSGHGGAAGAGGSGESGSAGKPPVVDCAALADEIDAQLVEAQACRPQARLACTGSVQNECDCPVIVDDPESAATRKYVAAVTELRKRCGVLCLDLVCRTESRGECVAGGPREGHCVANGLGTGPVTPPPVTPSL